MKRLFLIFTFLISFLFSNLAASAAENHLHTITLEKNNSGYNIILGTDSIAKVAKRAPSEDELILDLSGVSSSETVNAIYKGTNSIDSLVVENASPNKLRIHVKADDIKNSTVMMEPITGETTIVGETVPIEKILWVTFVLALFCVIFKVSKDISEEDEKVLIKQNIKDREIQMYKKYRRDMYTDPVIDSNNLRMKKMLKKIDRKIDERLTSAIK